MQTQEEEPIQEAESTSPSPDTVQTDWRGLVHRWWKATVAVLPIYLMTRLIFLLITYFGGTLFTINNYSTIQLSLRDLLYQSWYHWDAIRFGTIALQGYIDPENAAFFPLFPTLESILHKGLHLDVLVAGMFISNLALLGTLVVLYRLVETEFDAEIAWRTVLYLSVFPSALFFFTAYNESLFIFLMLLSLYTLRRGQWWLAGLFGFLATLTRSAGLLLAVVFLYEFLRQNLPTIRQLWGERQIKPLLLLGSGLLAGLLIPLGLGIYAYSLKVHYGDPLAFSHAQVHWRENLSFPWKGPITGLNILLHQSPFTFASPHILIDLTAVMLFLVLLVLCFWGPERLARDQWSFALLGILLLILGLLFPGAAGASHIPYDPIPSMDRFVLEIFVGFIILARLGRRAWFHLGYLLLSLPMLTFLTLQFMTGHWTV